MTDIVERLRDLSRPLYRRLRAEEREYLVEAADEIEALRVALGVERATVKRRQAVLDAAEALRDLWVGTDASPQLLLDRLCEHVDALRASQTTQESTPP